MTSFPPAFARWQSIGVCNLDLNSENCLQKDVKAAALTVARGAQGFVMCGIFVEGIAELGLVYAKQQLNVKYSNLKTRLMAEVKRDGRTSEVEAGSALGMWCHRLVVFILLYRLVRLA